MGDPTIELVTSIGTLRPRFEAVDLDLGFTGTRKEALAIWQAAASRWEGVNGRPSSGDLEAYRELAAQKFGGRILILGVTPELRDLVAEDGGSPVLVDMSAAMHGATTKMLLHADPADETWFECNWSDLDLPPASFDLVLGDMIWWALSVADQLRLRDDLHAVLDPEGLFVGRFRFTDFTRAELDPVPVVAGFLERLERSPAEARAIETELVSWIYDHTADHAAQRLNRARSEALLVELASVPELRRGAQFLTRASTRLVNADWTSQSREELLELLSSSFVVVAEGCASDYDASQRPVLALRPR